ncbi:hypothetical protein Pcinc_022794 [Petrolisthes cinctipes]|uniref:Ribosome biogenesis protein BOP1 homolog n=1 Tax=Petrolisthes cinctipes TaxID=88211 RepID=A0AAE1FDI1_PETCI|nr:hypothetical protein Pcinc_022794 [Petrolisthes cinctipes]
MNGKRKREKVTPASKVFGDNVEQMNFPSNVNAIDDGDSSDPDESDVEDDEVEGHHFEEEGGNEDAEDEKHESKQNGEVYDSEETDSINEDDIEDVSGDEEEGVEGEVDSLDGDDDDDDDDEDYVPKGINEDGDSDDETEDGKVEYSDDETKGAEIETSEGEKGKKIDKKNFDEYAADSSDEEDLRNTIGDVPVKWYDEYPHMGYDLDAKQILKPNRGDTLDELLNRMENPDYNRTVIDKQTLQDVRLSDNDLEVVKRLMSNRVPDPKYDMYQPWIDHFTHEVMEMPLSGRPEHKRSFIPSKAEAQYVERRAKMIRRGLITYSHHKKKREERRLKHFDLWAEHEQLRRVHDRLPAPKPTLPGHADSYNPPPEYINEEDTRYKSVRLVPAYTKAFKDQHTRCLDLYIAPRQKVMRVTVKSRDLLPVLPKPRDLQPFPKWEGIIFKGHRSIIRTISVHPKGKYLASGSDDHTVRIWEVGTGRCLRSFDVGEAVKCVTWNPSNNLFLLAVVIANKVLFMNPETYLVESQLVDQTNAVFTEPPDQGDYIQPERVRTAVTWKQPTREEWSKGIRIVLEFFRTVKQLVWHKQGDYFATMIPEGDHRSVIMHQLSRWRSQLPFKKLKGRAQYIEFHPKLPFLYVATQQQVRVYDLMKQHLLKKVKVPCKWISCLAIHPGGDHFLVGGYDRKVVWFEMEYTARPLMLRYHKEAVRSVVYHRKYPLFATASDEGRVIVSHGMVYDDYLKDPFLVPVKELRGHSKFQDLCVLSLAWHPYEPFLFTGGADATIRLWH